jgi:hypothetical protein
MKRRSPAFALFIGSMTALLAIISCVLSPEGQGENEGTVERIEDKTVVMDLLIEASTRDLERRLACSEDPCYLVGTPVSNEDDPEICYQYEIRRIEDQKCIEKGFFYKHNPRLAAQGPVESSDDAFLDNGSIATLDGYDPPAFYAYEHVDYGGDVLEVRGNVRSLVDVKMTDGKRNWNDKISSINYVKCSGYLYRHVDYKGGPFPVEKGQHYSRLSTWGWNDCASSHSVGNQPVKSEKRPTKE